MPTSTIPDYEDLTSLRLTLYGHRHRRRLTSLGESIRFAFVFLSRCVCALSWELRKRTNHVRGRKDRNGELSWRNTMLLLVSMCIILDSISAVCHADHYISFFFLGPTNIIIYNDDKKMHRVKHLIYNYFIFKNYIIQYRVIIFYLLCIVTHLIDNPWRVRCQITNADTVWQCRTLFKFFLRKWLLWSNWFLYSLFFIYC